MNTQFSTSYLLVDGYNIIYAWENLRKIAGNSLDNARSKLVDILSNYRGFKVQEIIVVFDAHKVEGGIGSIKRHNGIYIVYTKEAETADEYIEWVTGQMINQKKRVRVATSDALEQIIILGRGAIRLTAVDLLREVKEIESAIRKKIDEPKPVKKNQLFENLDSEIAAVLERMRLDDGRSKGNKDGKK